VPAALLRKDRAMFGIGIAEIILLAIIGLPILGGIVAVIVLVMMTQRRKDS
jgi:hypothetical protein